jgi:hypothetical protein
VFVQIPTPLVDRLIMWLFTCRSAWDITDLKGLSRVCSLYSSGWLHCWDHHSLKALCRLDLTNWPYDSQNCTVTLSTVSQSEEEIELMVMGAHVSRIRSADGFH